MFAGLVLAAILAQANAEQVPATLLIWGGGKTRAEAETALTAFRAASKQWPFFRWEPLWPQLLESGKVPGLKAGSFVVALGVCFPPEAEPLVAALKVLEPAVTQRPVTWSTPLPCPQSADTWTWGAPARSKNLAAVAFAQGEAKLVIAARTDANARLQLLDGGSCDSGAFVPGKTGLMMEVTCVTGRCAKKGRSIFTLSLAVLEGAVVMSSTLVRVIDPAQCN